MKSITDCEKLITRFDNVLIDYAVASAGCDVYKDVVETTQDRLVAEQALVSARLEVINVAEKIAFKHARSVLKKYKSKRKDVART